VVESTGNISDIRFDSAGLVPAIAQDMRTGRVLMMAWMNREALERTLEGGRACFFSRSRKVLWLKGETSGNFLYVRGIDYDCDGDTLLLSVDPAGPACHTGEESCFFRRLKSFGEANEGAGAESGEGTGGGGQAGDVLEGLQGVLEERKSASPETSYVAGLYAGGVEAMLAKVSEEAGEFMEAAREGSDKEVIHEAADLLFHAMVMLAGRGLSIDGVVAELSRRAGTSGIEEKRSRKEKKGGHGG